MVVRIGAHATGCICLRWCSCCRWAGEEGLVLVVMAGETISTTCFFEVVGCGD